MGMFDYIRVYVPLPGDYVWEKDNDFQTKSLENMMDEYSISPQGKLIARLGHTEYDEGELDILGLRPHHWVEDGEEEIQYHGFIEFHDVWCPGTDPNDERCVFVNYLAKFTDGRLEGIKLLNDVDQRYSPYAAWENL